MFGKFCLLVNSMASSSANPGSDKRKRPRESYPLLSKISVQEFFDKNHRGRYETERQLLEIYNNRIKRLVEQNSKDQAIIIVNQGKIDYRNQQIQEIREKIVDIYKSIEDNLFIT